MHLNPMKGSELKSVVSLALLTVAAVLMCLGVRWLFFMGLALVGLSGFICWIQQRPGKWLSGIFYLLVVIALLLWLSSFGREPLPVWGACAGLVAGWIGEVQSWRQKDTRNA